MEYHFSWNTPSKRKCKSSIVVGRCQVWSCICLTWMKSLIFEILWCNPVNGTLFVVTYIDKLATTDTSWPGLLCTIKPYGRVDRSALLILFMIFSAGGCQREGTESEAFYRGAKHMCGQVFALSECESLKRHRYVLWRHKTLVQESIAYEIYVKINLV